MIWRANQLTGFYMRATLAINGLMEKSSRIVFLWYSQELEKESTQKISEKMHREIYFLIKLKAAWLPPKTVL